MCSAVFFYLFERVKDQLFFFSIFMTEQKEKEISKRIRFFEKNTYLKF